MRTPAHAPLRSPMAEALRARIRRGIDAVVLAGASVGTVVQLLGVLQSPTLTPTLACAIAFMLGACALFGMLGHAPWTPAAYVGLVMVANGLYLWTYGPWFGMGAVYVVTLALTFLFLSPRWWRWVVIVLAGTPFLLGVGKATGLLIPGGIWIDDVTSWRRAGVAACTALIGLAVLIRYVVRHLVAARRDIERAHAVERAQREAQSRIDAELAQARRVDLIAELAAEVGAEVGAALAIVHRRQQALAAVMPGVQAREYLDEIDEAASAAAGAMRSLTAFAPDVHLGAASAGSATDAANALTRLVRRTIPARISLETRADDMAWVPIPTSDLTRILSNLVLNARDAITDAGTIKVDVTRASSEVVIAVADNGAGMDAPVRARLFQPFFTTKPVGRGTGLGLATTKVLVERAGGTIEVDTIPAQGTRFTIRLPAVPAP